MSIPSNLIPLKITQLPEDPSPSDTGWMMYVNNGTTYKVQVSAVLNVSGVPTTRTITAGAGLTGGGDLSANRTISVAVGGIGYSELAASGVTPGTYGSSSELPIITVDQTGRVTAATTTSFSVSGFVPTTRQVIAGIGLTGGGALNADVTLNAVFSDAVPLALGAATPGAVNVAAREGHVHPAVDLASTVETTGVLGMVSGGTGVAHTAPAAGAIAYSDGSGIQLSTVGSSGQVFVSGGTGAPVWGSALIVSDQPANYFYAGPTSGPDAPTAFRAMVNADLPASGVTANTYGTQINVPVFAVNAKGVITSVTNTAIGNLPNSALVNSSITINGTAIALGGSVSVGDVVGPASATDNAIARFDLTTGKVIQNSTVIIDDNGNINQANAITFDVTPATLPTTPGTLYWDNADGNQTLSLVMEGNHATQQIGEEMYYRVKASSAITEGQTVMFTGTVGASGGLTGAPAAGLTAATASYLMGVATQDIPLNGWGYVTSFGLVRGINTTGGAEAWTDGQILYYNPAIAGGLTKTLPTAPNAKVQVCAVVYAATNGSLFVRPSFGGELGQYEGDVGFTSVAAGNLIRRNAGNTAWENVVTIPNTNLANSAITIGTTAISLGASSTTLGGLTSVGSTSFTGELTGNASTATTLATARNIAGVSFNGSADIAIPLANLSDTSIATPTVDQILKYNGTVWVNGAANSISGGAGIEFFNATPIITATGTNNAIQIATLSQTPVTTAEQTTSTTSIVGTVASSAWISPALGRTIIDAGIWDSTVFASVSTAAGTNTITRNVYSALPFVTGTVTTTGTGTSRTATASAGTPFAITEIDASATNTVASYLQTPQGLYQITARTSDTEVTITTLTTYVNESAVAGTVWKLLFGGLTTPNLTTTIAQYDKTTTQGAFTITALTKLGGITFVTSSSAGRTFTTTYNGTTRNTHIASPLAVLHNQLGGLQGGTTNELYHSTLAEYTGTGTGVFARAASPTFTGTLTCATLVATTGISGGTF